MLLVQDQYGQKSRKNFDSEFQLKQNTSKQVFSDPKEAWEIESGCEEEVITSGNESEAEENIPYADPSDIPDEILETRGQTNSRKKNVRFDYILDTSETSSLDNEYLGIDSGYLETTRRRSLGQDPEVNGWKAKDHFRVNHKTKWRSLDCGYEKARPKSSPEKIAGYVDGLEKRHINLGEYDGYRNRRKEHRCGKNHYEDFDDAIYRKPNKYKFECGDETMARCCDYYGEKKTCGKMKPVTTSGHKHLCHLMKDPEIELKTHRKLRVDSPVPYVDRYCQDEYYDHSYAAKTKKKTLEAVQEQQELFSDSTYKIPCGKFSSQTIPGEVSGFPGKRSLEKDSSISDWLYYGGRGNGGSLGPPRIHKMRSRRTRMNKIKNGWKKALVQTVRDGCRNERVGVIVMGSKGPEFYAKNSKPGGFVPFRKSKSFLDGTAKSFEVMTVDCKNVFLSSSEPGPRTNHTISDLVCPEDETKMEEKFARFSKNVNDIVKHSEEKFYKALSSSDYPNKNKNNNNNNNNNTTEESIFKGAGEGGKEEAKQEEEKEDEPKGKFPKYGLYPFETMSPRVSKSLRKHEKKISPNSKARADALNEQAKQYIENQSSLKDKEDLFLEGLKELQEKFPPKELSQETIEANLSLWGMKLEHLETETKESGKKAEEEKEETREEEEKVESNEQTHRLREDGDGGVKQPPEVGSPRRREKKNTPDANSNLISAVFRDLVENGRAISQEESENLQTLLNQVSNDVNEVTSSSGGSELVKIRPGEEKLNATPRSPKTPSSLEEDGKRREKERKHSEKNRDLEGFLDEVTRRKVVKMKSVLDDQGSKTCRKTQEKQKEGKLKKMNGLEDRMKLLRQALPSIAAENEAAHLKQLKRYIDKFIGRAEASTHIEFTKRKETRRKTKSLSTDSSEVRVDACKILDFVSNPFKKISSEVTINIAKKLTDTLVQDKTTKGPRNIPTSGKPRKQSENETDDEGFGPCDGTSGSDRCEPSEPAYLKQLKKMRNEHLNNIILEVKRLSELLRFLDRCNRLHF